MRPLAFAAAKLALVHLAACLLADHATQALQDALAAVQLSTEVGTSLLGEALRRSRFGRRPLDGPAAPHFNCSAEPVLCEPPFNCHKQKLVTASLALADGRPNYSTWCESPDMLAALKCQRCDLEGYGRELHKAQLSIPVIGRATKVVGYHYCFAFGHCDNVEVTLRTRVREAEAMYDQKFGQLWRRLAREEPGVVVQGLVPGRYSRDFNKSEACFAELACAMGNYHCDMKYCRQEFCHSPEFVTKYDRVGRWHKAQERERKAQEKELRNARKAEAE